MDLRRFSGLSEPSLGNEVVWLVEVLWQSAGHLILRHDVCLQLQTYVNYNLRFVNHGYSDKDRLMEFPNENERETNSFGHGVSIKNDIDLQYSSDSDGNRVQSKCLFYDGLGVASLPECIRRYHVVIVDY